MFVGDCVVCYMVFGGVINVGGFVFDMLFGMIYMMNFMFDLDIGIGVWLYLVFVCVMCEGILCDGLYLYLVFLYIVFVKLSEFDLFVFYVYLML